MTKKKLYIIFILAIMCVSGVAIFLYWPQSGTRSTSDKKDEGRVNIDISKDSRMEAKSKKYGVAKEIKDPTGLINTDGPINIQQYIGKKVILVDFWTYSCINCQRTLPYLVSWYEKYKDDGLIIIGVHTPEFNFEKNYDNVKTAVEKYGLKYPVVLDNNHATWDNYGSRYWPNKYLIDIDGFIVQNRAGEGAYDETEKKIQELLEERRQVLAMPQKEMNNRLSEGEKVDFSQIHSPEIYFGASRNEHLGNGQIGKTGEYQFILPQNLKDSTLYLSGKWNITDEYSQNNGEAKIFFRYSSKDVHFVASSDSGAIIEVLRDGQPPKESSGRDLNKDTSQTSIKEPQLYNLISDPQAYGEHLIEIIIKQGSLKAFTFTFG